MVKITREAMVEQMIVEDIEDIININAPSGDNSFLYSVLSGEGWKPYNQLTDEEIEAEYSERGIGEKEDEEEE